METKDDKKRFIPISPGKFEALPHCVMRLPTNILSWNDKAVLLSLLSHSPDCFPSISTISRETGIPVRTVNDILDRLRTLNVISSQRGGVTLSGRSVRSNIYMVYHSEAMWEAKTVDEFEEAARKAKEDFERRKKSPVSAGSDTGDNVIEIAKKESPTSVGADADDKNKNNNLYYHDITNEAICQPPEHKGINAILPWASQENCEKIALAANKVIQKAEIVPYIEYCAKKMQESEENGTKIKSRTAYLIKIIQEMTAQYRSSKRKATPPPPKYDPVYDDAEWLYAKFHGKEDKSSDGE